MEGKGNQFRIDRSALSIDFTQPKNGGRPAMAKIIAATKGRTIAQARAWHQADLEKKRKARQKASRQRAKEKKKKSAATVKRKKAERQEKASSWKQLTQNEANKELIIDFFVNIIQEMDSRPNNAGKGTEKFN